jgi:signal transduction histidine kinase
MTKRNISMRSDTNGVLHAEIKDGILSRLIDDGPALVAAIMVTAASTVVGWGIYSDLAGAFYASAHGQFLAMLAVVCIIVGSAGFGFGRSSGIRRARAKDAAAPTSASAARTVRTTRPESPASGALGRETPTASPSAEGPTATRSREERLRFLSDAAQELRAPLTSMCLAARIIRKHHESTPEVVERFGETLILEADKLGGTIDEFLDLTRIESGCIDWNERDLEPAELINDAISEIEALAISYGVGVSFVLEPELNPILADYDRIRQMLTVLLGIAVREAADDVEICIQIAEANGGWIITVGDSGRVYAHSQARRIVSWTDPEAEEGDRATDPASQAIGLHFCRKVVARYEGRLWVEGNLTEAGCVRVTIPYPTEQALARAGAAAKRTQTANGAASGPASDPDLASRHQAAVRALSERAAHQDTEEGALDGALESETRTADADEETANETVTEAAASRTQAESPQKNGALAVRPDKDLLADSSESIGDETDVPASDKGDLPEKSSVSASPELPEAASADAGNTTTATSNFPSPAAAKTGAPTRAAATSSNLNALDVLRGKATKKPSAAVIEDSGKTGAHSSPQADETPEESTAPTPAASTASTERRSTASLRHRSAAGSRPRIPGASDDSVDGNQPAAASRPVSGMAISARRRPGTRPMLALSGPADSAITDKDTSVRAASDKDLLELAFGDDKQNTEASRAEAELVAKATGTTIAPYNPNARTARTVRSAAARSAARHGGETSRGREESSPAGEKRNARLDGNVAKRLGIK